MNILVIGSGGREHAVTRAFSKSSLAQKLFCAPGNAGTAQIAQNLQIDLKNHEDVVKCCIAYQIDFVFIGPEDPLVEGLSNSLRSAGITVFGPSQEAAQLEGSKLFAKDFMNSAKVPTARAVAVGSVDAAMNAAPQFTPPYVLKADGLAAGKGVFICRDLGELKAAADTLFVKKVFGQAGMAALLEQNLPGYELSFLVLTDGQNYQALPIAQDHKRLCDGNLGPNTGGMGTIAPMQIPETLYNKILERIVAPSVAELSKRQFLFRGVLFIGLMIVDNDPFVLEYNVRFGDPETQVILPLLKNDIASLFYELAQGHLQKIEMNGLAACCVVNAAAGYPDTSVKETAITLPDETATQFILHAATKKTADGVLRANGGRVLNVMGIAESLKEAIQNAYTQNSQIQFNGRQFRSDIGANNPLK
jgi:phosphoribosylamine---glycine ligase